MASTAARVKIRDTQMAREIRKRRYRQTRRAALQEQTRRRITEAAVELHGSVGPARTTISAIAERAGVQRATVYRHFPDEAALFAACSSHWSAANPPPNPEEWASIPDPDERTRRALTDLYAYFARNEQMLANLIRDEDRVAVLPPLLAPVWGYLDAVADLLAPRRGGKRTRAALRHAVDFRTWRSLARDGGLANDDVVALMSALVRAA
jgi:AcrR family transcriptional regulator